MSYTVYPSEFIRLGDAQTKTLNVVLCIEGLPECFSTLPTFTTLKYGDPVVYGQPGLIYGGLRLLTDIRAVIGIETNLTIAQRLEPEQGRASIQQMTFQLIDKDGTVADLLLTNGEILGRRVKVVAGYQNSSYPQDYIVAFRGMVTNLEFQTGRVILALGDYGQKRRTAIFRAKKTDLTAGINASTLSIPVTDNVGFYNLTVNQNALPVGDQRVKPYLKIENEFIRYGFGAAVGTTSMTVLERGARGTTAAVHAINTEVSHAVELKENAITLALQLMLSGSGNVALPAPQAFGTVVDPAITPATNVILFKAGVNLNRDFGVVVGDTVTIAGAGANNGTYTITAFGPSFGDENRIMYLSSALVIQNPAVGTVTFKSQFDVLPEQMGLKIAPVDVDVDGHVALRNDFFLGAEYTLEIFVTEQQTGKEFIESQCYLPIGAYALTRSGRLSMGFTKPPLATDRLLFLTEDNVINPVGITTSRGLNTRKFFNEIQFEYDPDDSGNYQKVIRALDTDSLNEIGILSLLPIKAKGLKAGSGELVANRVTRRLLGRYKSGAIEINLTTNFGSGSQIEAGDVVVVVDDGNLKIQNFETGERNVGSILVEVVDRTLDLKTGQTKLKLITGLGTTLTDRFGVIAPSSLIQASGTTNTLLKLKTSFGVTDQTTKWADYIGEKIVVHNAAWTQSAEATIQAISSTIPNALELVSALPFTPGENFIVDIVGYGTTGSVDENKLYKLLFAFVDPTLGVLTGSTTTVIQLSAGDAAKCKPGQLVFIRNSAWSIESSEVEIQSVGATSITLSEALSFTPLAGYFVELVGFTDGGGAYRIT